eukprot:Nk52_evm18s305 gene=Nk52_evmTU18s305
MGVERDQTAVVSTDCPALELLGRGKVRDVYRVDKDHVLFVATDRVSAFDVVMENGIPGKGKILNAVSKFWFGYLKDVCANHFITDVVDEMPEVVRQYKSQLEGRAMLVRSLEMLPVEVIIRGYITGSGWKDYKATGSVCGITLPPGLQECAKLEPSALYTPSTKADQGDHDENISKEKAAELMGAEIAAKVESLGLEVYRRAAEYALSRGVIIADTKMEFGLLRGEGGAYELVLGDEVLTPDSSRFWPAEGYAVGRTQESFDKQYIRNYLESIKFDKKTPIELPEEVVHQTVEKYNYLMELLCGGEEAREK